MAGSGVKSPPEVVELYSHGDADGCIPLAGKDMRRYDGRFAKSGRTEGSRKAQSPERPVTRGKWVRVHGTELGRVVQRVPRQVSPLEYVKGARGNITASEVDENNMRDHVKEREEQFKEKGNRLM